MPKTPKEECKDPEETVEPPRSWSDDQKEWGYYYDDAHGYEKYVEKEDEEEKDDE